MIRGLKVPWKTENAKVIFSKWFQKELKGIRILNIKNATR